MNAPPPALTVVVPTLGREGVLIDSLEQVLNLEDPPDQLVVVDQTPAHEPETQRRLADWRAAGRIAWDRPAEASIPKAMNRGLMLAETPLVLFLDDDVRPHLGLIAAHRRAHAEFPEAWAVVGQVIQPWQSPANLPRPPRRVGLRDDRDFPFHSVRPGEVANVMAGNLSVKRDRALAVGGFDERFYGAAYRFETDFARRLIAAGGTIRFAPDAAIDHLRVPAGGTRDTGSHLTSADPKHGFGDYYYALRHGRSVGEKAAYCLNRAFREVRTKFHLARPWWIPVKLLGEARAFAVARKAARGEPLLMNGDASPADPSPVAAVRGKV
ncbi:glycosyltransferase family 2 protein [Alienimonas sp. DA493]|uniref:glycosyltransferase family 2 protein n=1 Tax=Alienimonas sp. DA493 TaxID=3373605 RepID=UPI003754EA53